MEKILPFQMENLFHMIEKTSSCPDIAYENVKQYTSLLRNNNFWQ